MALPFVFLWILDASLAAPAHAQSTQATPAESPTPAKARASGKADLHPDGGETVYVTSRRRKERLQDVPETVNSISGKEMARLGVRTLSDLAQHVAGAQNLDYLGGAMPTWVIRGVSLDDFNPNSTPAAPIFIDDVYQPTSVMSSGALFDIARTEILKGPQSGLYGRNTIGGAVRVITNQPSFDAYHGDGSVSYGSFGDMMTNAAVGGPITQNLAFRIAESSDHGWDGWQKSLATGEDWGRPNRDAVRLTLAATFGDTDANLSVYASRDKSQLPLVTLTSSYTSALGFCPAFVAGDAFSPSCLTIPQVFGQSEENVQRQSQDGSTVLSSPINQLDNSSIGTHFKLDHHFGDITLTSLTSFDYFNYGLTYNYAGTDTTYATEYDRVSERNVQESLRLASSDAHRLSWLLGADLSYEDLQDNRLLSADQNPLLAYNNYYLRYTQKTQAYSLYGQGIYKITPKLKLEADLRSTWDYETYSGSFNESVTSIYDSTSDRQYQLKDHLSGNLTLSYQAQPNVMLYASATRGNKVGGFYGNFPVSSTDQVSPYKEEEVWAGEMGFKASRPQDRITLDGAIYYYRTYNYQAFSSAISPATGGLISLLTNIGTVVNKGAELSAGWSPIRHLTLNAGAVYTDAQVVSGGRSFFDSDGSEIPWDGMRLPFAPRWSMVGSVRYELPVLKGKYIVGLQADYNYRTDLVQTRGIASAAVTNVPGYGIMGAEFDIRSAKGGWHVALIGQNVLDTRYRAIGDTDGAADFDLIYGPPASYRIEAGYSF